MTFWSPSEITSPLTSAVECVTLVTEVVLTWGRVFLRQRTDNPRVKASSQRYMEVFDMERTHTKYPPPPVEDTEEDCQNPASIILLKSPQSYRMPPGSAVNPEEFVTPVFGGYQPAGIGCVDVLLNAPTAMLLCEQPLHAVSAEGSKYFTKTFHSRSDGTCQPVGHNPLPSDAA